MSQQLGLFGGAIEETVKEEKTSIIDQLASSRPGDYQLKPDSRFVFTPGDIWLINEHRLMCGDSRDINHVKKLCNNKGIQLIHSDPPYNVGVNPGGSIKSDAAAARTEDSEAAKSRSLQGDFITTMDFGNRLIWWFRNMYSVLDPGRSFYIWAGFSNLGNYPQAIRAGWLHWHQLIIWVKSQKVLTRLDFMGQHEVCFYGWKAVKGFKHKILNETGVPDVWFVENVSRQKMVHLTEKPVEIPRMAIELSSDEGENVLDLFGGSGSTLIAAEETGRKARLMEIDEEYCRVILERCNYLGYDIRKES